jgi:hypothetical protein
VLTGSVSFALVDASDDVDLESVRHLERVIVVTDVIVIGATGFIVDDDFVR